MANEGAQQEHNGPGDRPGTPPSAPSLRIVPLTDRDLKAAARLYTDVFLSDEPTTVRHAPDPVRFLPSARCYLRLLVNGGLSFVARDETTGDLVGFIFCIDLLDDPAEEGPEMKAFVSQFGHAVALIDELEDRYLDRASIERGSGLHIFQIGVDRSYRSTGLARALIRRSLAHARERGYRTAVADCTNPASRRAFERCGFVERGVLSYDAFSSHGVRFFAGIEGGISLMVHDLDSEDDSTAPGTRERRHGPIGSSGPMARPTGNTTSSDRPRR
jgi:ribosomal protein S18 acetylase RimI-like enzyme